MYQCITITIPRNYSYIFVNLCVIYKYYLTKYTIFINEAFSKYIGLLFCVVGTKGLYVCLGSNPADTYMYTSLLYSHGSIFKCRTTLFKSYMYLNRANHYHS